MARRFMIASGKVGPAFDSHEEIVHAKYLKARAIGGSEQGRSVLVVTDLCLYPVKGSAGLRAAADRALETELEASIKSNRK